MEWISVDEQLPPIWDYVLLAFGSHKYTSKRHVIGYRVPEDLGWGITWAPVAARKYPVTHWMPLPAPPESPPPN